MATADAARRFELLLALYRGEKAGAELPPAALALQAVRAKDREAGALATANGALEAALRSPPDAFDAPLQSLAQQRARAIQDALLASGEVESARVFLLAPGASPAANNKVRCALSLK